MLSIALWVRMDSNHRSRKTADLQSAPFGHSGTHPRVRIPRTAMQKIVSISLSGAPLLKSQVKTSDFSLLPVTQRTFSIWSL